MFKLLTPNAKHRSVKKLLLYPSNPASLVPPLPTRTYSLKNVSSFKIEPSLLHLREPIPTHMSIIYYKLPINIIGTIFNLPVLVIFFGPVPERQRRIWGYHRSSWHRVPGHQVVRSWLALALCMVVKKQRFLAWRRFGRLPVSQSG